MTSEYKIEIVRDGRWWMVRVPELNGLTQARRLSEAKLMGREWIAVTTGTPLDDVSVQVSSITVPGCGDVHEAAQDIIDMRERAAIATRKAQDLTEALANELVSAGIPVRDAGELLEVSPQRISQLSDTVAPAVASGKLFDEFTRFDDKPARHLESTFAFLDRRAGALWDRVRDHLEICYAAFPEEHKPGLVSRLRKADVRQHLPAWWELYVFTLFDCLGYDIKVHPELSGSNNKPDFLVTKGSSSMYVEAAVMFNGELDSDAWNWVCDCVNDAKNPDFMVDLEIRSPGKQRPRARDIIAPLEKWLASLDADRVIAEQAAGHPLPHTQLTAGDWILDYTAVPVRPDRRGTPRRLIAIYPTKPAQFGKDVEQLRKTLNKKGGKYNTPDRPLVVAITTWNSIHKDDLREALFGSIKLAVPRDNLDEAHFVHTPDGYWRPGADPRGSRISAVLFGDAMRAWSVASKLPELWINPWAVNSMPSLPPFATVVVGDDGKLARTDASATAASLFGLPPDWPNSD
ncbi:hypothetical protein [Mycobacterium botniense]|uniref:Uncharacterized protein n=1 Tax=Mycobacterium botniense TaxID=84962 RepID=A0A7I9XYY0_9MYCO|nr:hypothetical protein [Mycobacterium botniense]GFG75031.1 hypothetical protein MBOT_23960 [Mycobacterium botniense]